MESMQKQIDALRGDVDQVTDKLDRVLEILASLSLPSRVDVAAVGANPLIGSPLSKVVWPSFGSSSEYTSAVAQVTQEPMDTDTEFLIGRPRTHQVQPSFAMPQTLEDHKNAHQGDGSKGKFVVSPSEKTHQKFKAIEDKLRMMESFMPSNVCPPHSLVPTCDPYLKHQYPVTVRHQQPKRFPNQAMHMPFHHLRSGQFAHNKGQQQNQPKTSKKRKVFDSIPIPYSNLFPHLVHIRMVIPRALKPMTAPFPAWYDLKAKCEFHSGAEGHTIENCKAFKHKVQALIDQKLLTFKEGEPNREG
ncbi:hypothetical protein QL285_049490 [Trifolium repens]|nr:hypothetical protein QL285_049490 [Trifolium repens]